MIKKPLTALLCVAFLSGVDLMDTASTNETSSNIISSASYGKKVVTENRLTGIDLLKTDAPLYYNETLLNWVMWANISNPRAGENIGTNTKMLIAAKPSGDGDDNAIADAVKTIAVKGYCYITNDIEVGKQPGALRVGCETNAGAITMFANLVNVNEKASLVVDPLYIEKNGVRFKVASAIVTNEPKTSYNIATFVNDRKVSEIGWGALKVGSDEFKTSSNEYLKALEQSKVKQEVNYVSVTDGNGNVYPQAAMTTNTDKPDPLDYLVKAGINMTASVLSHTADVFKKDLPYLYYISKNTKIWIDLQVNEKGEYVK